MGGMVLVFGILAALVAITDFYIGERHDRKLKDRLTDLYIAVEAGDWSSLYKHPAAGLSEYMNSLLGSRIASLRYVLSVAALSTVMTLTLFAFVLCWSYAFAYINETRCPVPPFAQFLEIPRFMSNFIVPILVINATFDLLAWTVSRWGFSRLATSSARTSTLILVCIPVFSIGMLGIIYAIYLPLMIKLEANMRGFPFDWDHYLQILTANIQNVADLVRIPSHIFSISCRNPAHPIFSITAVGTMQILALETLLPAILLVLATTFGLFAVMTRPMTRPILSATIQRLQEHPKTIGFIIAAILSGIAALLAALQKFVGGS